MSEARKTIRKARLKEGSLLGTNGKAKVIPLLGDVSRGNAKNRLRLSAIPKAVPKRMIYAYAASLAGIATLLGVALLVRTGATHPWWAVAALAGVAALCERGRVKLSNTTESSIALLPVIFAAVVLGPLAALLVGAASLLGDFRPPYLKLVVYTSSRAITGAVAGFAAWFVAWLITDTFAAIAVGTLAAAIVAETADTSFAALTHKLRGNGTFANAVRLVAPLLVAAVPMYVPVVAILAAAYTEVSAWTLPLFFVPALAAQRLFALYREQRELAEELLSANSCLERAGLSFASALVATLDARDRYTAGHSAAVAVYARDIAARLGLPADQQQLAHLCGLVHDIGKVGLPPGLLEKAGPLTLEERRQMEEHPAIGERILANVENYAEIASIVRHHHERVDGNGYPDGLRGNDIPIVSRILAVADAYDAMTSDRPYREAMPTAVARMRLAQAVETQFDTTIVAAFEAILAGAPDSYRRATVEPARSDASPQRLSAPSVAAL
jgi:putative nucleotidyltransferase with HDIG domain